MPYQAKLRVDGKYEDAKAIPELLAGYSEIFQVVIDDEIKWKLADGSICEFYEAPQPLQFDPNDFDEWLIATYMGTAVEQYFPVLSRATEKNNPRGYQQMIAYAQAKGVSIEIQEALTLKLIELGANIQ
jgi:hypothetical protein